MQGYYNIISLQYISISYWACVWVFPMKSKWQWSLLMKMMILEIKVMIWPRRFFRNHCLTSKLWTVNHFMTIGECLLSGKDEVSIFIYIHCRNVFKNYTKNTTRQKNFLYTSDDFVERSTIRMWWKKGGKIDVRRHPYRGSLLAYPTN